MNKTLAVSEFQFWLKKEVLTIENAQPIGN